MLNDLRIGTLLKEIHTRTTKNRKNSPFFKLNSDCDRDKMSAGDAQFVFYHEPSGKNFLPPTKQEDTFKTVIGFFLYHFTPSQLNKHVKTAYHEISSSKVCRIMNNTANLDEIFVSTILDVSSEQIQANIINIFNQYLAYCKKNGNEDEVKRELEAFCLDLIDSYRIRYNRYSERSDKRFDTFRKNADSDNTTYDHEGFLKEVSYILEKIFRFSIKDMSISDSVPRSFYKKVEYLATKPAAKFDPHGIESSYDIDDSILRSTALIFKVVSSNPRDAEEEPYVNYSLQGVLRFILERACIIEKIECKYEEIGKKKVPSVVIQVKNYYPMDSLKLRYCDTDADIDQCVALTEKYKGEFRRKITWKKHDYDIARMARIGLKEQKKWRALAFFEEYGNRDTIVCYLDTKQRFDGNIELGIAVCEKDRRKKGLISSLTYFHILANMFAQLYGGTFTDNTQMMHVFERCGFDEHIFYDDDKKIRSSKILERFTDTPDDINSLSIYYVRKSLQNMVFNTFIAES